MREWGGKPSRVARGRDKACGQSARGQARTRGRSRLEPGSRGAQTMREKLWMPWNGLIVIGKRMELLGRNTQKPRMWDPKLESEDWRLEDVEKTALRGKSGRSQERMDVKRVRSVASALPASAGLQKDNSKEVWGRREVRHKIEAESENAGTTAGSRRGSEIKERLKFTGVGTSGEDLRSRGYKLGQNEERRSSGEKLRSSAEKLSSSGEKLRSSGEKLRSSGEKLRSSGEKLRSSGEKLRSSGEKLVFRGERRGSRGEKLGTSGEDSRSTGDKRRSSAEKLGSSREKLGTSGEKLEHSRMGSINEEKIERVVEVTGDEILIEITDAEMEIPFERVEENDEETEEGV
ncbi:uncharacterized protein LOC130850470 [Hippopotamus amphibius kiboko]|uniref:uncharacterized protein LOC130850470 n=1 Tax=Hippopotamus amphibius kiboko TaxID=575201 RepID=UPI0025917138|nr:uncharacterized protein LOC130850470 [Hippopotamus amphibius kiboko]XP_057586043.1 uncharacterized protein LOC130850470 [Hippopotamus amphibius kiboko]